MHKYDPTDLLVLLIGAALEEAKAEGKPFQIYLLKMALMDLGFGEAAVLGLNMREKKPKTH